ncbi:MAG: alpha/beta fold hydrolase [Hydrococcus sp. Prado102]|nr:alpha/beta fold hydrolase [Hydrococcus sp. Prado102]
MSEYAKIVAEIVRQTQTHEDTLPLRNEACRSRFFLQPNPAQKVCLFLHGFTAGPYQFAPMGKFFFRAGYNVLIPLMPGHGKAGEWSSNNPPPLPTDPQVYQTFVVQWLQLAQAMGKQVVVGGLSTGATLAAWLARKYPQQIYRTLLFAPYLHNKIKLLDFFVENFPFYFEWFNKDAQGNFGYKGFSIPALRLFLEMGQEIQDRASESLFAPMFILSSASDMVTSDRDHQILFESALKNQPITWYHCFDKALDIHHRMMTKMEGNDYQDLVITLAKAYIDSDLTWAEVLEIGAGIYRGKTFDYVVTELNLGDRVSPDLSVMMAVLNKQTIVDVCNP